MNKERLKDLSLINVAEEILKEKKEPTSIYTLLDEVALIKEIDTNDVAKLSQLYLDITLSAKFVFCGDGLWTLKEGNLELWDVETFTTEDLTEEVEEDDLIDFTEFHLEDEEVVEDEEDEEEEFDEEIKEEKEYIEVELPLETTDEDNGDEEIEFNDYDEDDYNEIMDDYEDMYDE